MANKGKIVVVSGPSGVGKGSVNRQLMADPKLKLVYSVSMTTRKPREEDVEGQTYFFVDKARFEQAIKNDELIEHAQFVGNYYGTPRAYVEKQTEEGKNVLLEIEVDGATQVLEKEKNVVSIFLMPPSLTELESRLQKRGTESKEVIKERLNKALLEMPLKYNYEYVVENDSIENALAKMTDILVHEGVTDYKNESAYDTVKKFVTEDVEENYEFFVKNWKENIEEINKIRHISTTDLANFDPKKELIDILTDRVYKTVLAHGEFRNLRNKEFVVDLVKRLMMDIDFFSIKQKVFINEK